VDHVATTRQKMLRVVDLLCEDAALAEPFLAPVKIDVAADYYVIITTPMDLGTVRTRIAAAVYDTEWALFVSDLQLIYDNCRKYNHAEGNEYAIMATKMERRTRLLLEALAAADEREDAEQEAAASAASAVAAAATAARSALSAASPTEGEAVVTSSFVAESTRRAKYEEVTGARRLARLQLDQRDRDQHSSLPLLPARSKAGMRAVAAAAAAGRTTRNDAYFPELEHINAAMPPCTPLGDDDSRLYGGGAAAVASSAAEFYCGTVLTNPVLSNLRSIQRIRDVHDIAAAASVDTGGGGQTVEQSALHVEEWPALGRPMPSSKSSATTGRRMGAAAAAEVLGRGCGVLALHAGFQDSEASVISNLAEVAASYAESLCACMRQLVDDDDGRRRSLDDVVLLAVQNVAVGGVEGVARYWRDDVVGFGAQLQTVEQSVYDKYSGLMALESAATSTIADNDVSLVGGNFGDDVGNIGVDLLGLQELELSPHEGIPDQLLRGFDLTFDRPYTVRVKRARLSQSGGRSGPKQRRWPYTDPGEWAPIDPAQQIALLREPLEAAATAAAALAARGRSRNRGRGGRGRSRKASQPELVVPGAGPAMATSNSAATAAYSGMSNGHF
jgi:hypothetical protein